MNGEFEHNTFILTQTECNGWFRTIAYDFRFHQTIRVCRTDPRRANEKLKISASKKRYARYSFALTKLLISAHVCFSKAAEIKFYIA